jgi:hypothetical protein
MRFLQLQGRIRGRMWVGCLLAAVVGGVVAAGPYAAAAPRSASSLAGPQLATGERGSSAGRVSWSVFPATSTGPDSQRSLFSYGIVTAGSTIADHVEIVNRGKKPAAFSIYATDATGTTLQGALTLLPAGQQPVDIGAWAQFPGSAARLSMIIPGGQAIIEPFTVTVPRQATPGDHTGGLIAAVQVLQENTAGVNVGQNYQIAVPIELRVPGALHAALQVQSISTGFGNPLNPFGNGSATISYTVTNTGNVRQTGTQLVRVTGPFGQSSFVRPPHLPTILPGDSIRVPVSVPGLFPDGGLTADVAVTPGWPPRTARLARSAPEASGTAPLLAIPWSLIGFVLLLVALGFGGWQLLRWRRRLRQAELAAVVARVRRETEERILGRQAATAPGVNRDSGNAATGSATE